MLHLKVLEYLRIFVHWTDMSQLHVHLGIQYQLYS